VCPCTGREQFPCHGRSGKFLFSTQNRRRNHQIPATFFDEASSEVHLRSPVRSSPCPARLDGSSLPWASPLCCRTLRYLALAGVGDWPGHWLEPDHESSSLKLVQHHVAIPPQNRACDFHRTRLKQATNQLRHQRCIGGSFSTPPSSAGGNTDGVVHGCWKSPIHHRFWRPCDDAPTAPR
jgi:hypothetical protein